MHAIRVQPDTFAAMGRSYKWRGLLALLMGAIEAGIICTTHIWATAKKMPAQGGHFLREGKPGFTPRLAPAWRRRL
jgi:hypothetical protein